jgi:uncharacterized protein
MKLPEDCILLRIFLAEGDRHKNKPLYEHLVLEARRLNLAGATVLRGVLGFGAHSRLHSAKLLDISEDLPLVIEIVDTEDKINLLLPIIDETLKDGLVTLEKVRVVQYRHSTTASSQ